MRSTGESGTEGAVEGSIMARVVERLDESICADAVLAALLGDSWADEDAVLPMPPRESTGASALSTVCLRCMLGILR